MADRAPSDKLTPARQTARMGLGQRGEQLAAEWLQRNGYTLLARNWRCSYGELDVIAESEGEIVAVEVKTRRGDHMGAPEEAITSAKSRRLIATIQTYLLERGEEHLPYRIDVIAVQLTPTGKLLDVRHYRSAVTLET